jgi:3-oxoacyl-[acyl-carrier-protein] synthase II
MPAYINSYSVISPQETFSRNGFPENIKGQVTDRLKCIEPDYRDLINPLQLRRMPRILKMGLATAVSCLKKSDLADPDAIIVGTGLGCLESLEKFLLEVIENEEKITSVLPFINSTHNAVASQIALVIKNFGYNYTYCHRAFSFESALQDALVHFEEKPSACALVGGIDECTENYIKLQSYLTVWKKPVITTELFTSGTTGTIAGEGSAFFLLSGSQGKNCHASVADVHTFYKPGSTVSEIVEELEYFIERSAAGVKPDVVIAGLSGDKDSDSLYRQIAAKCFGEEITVAGYKHLCGEYFTSSAFALWLADVIAELGQVPQAVMVSGRRCDEIKNILIYNIYRNTGHSMIMVRC